jgi:hypothetical protein
MPVRPPINTQTRLEIKDLVAAAARAGHQIKPRLITDWASLGLIDQPEARGRGRGKGKRYTWPREQRDLLLTLLAHHGTVRRPTLCNIPVGIWLTSGDHHVPLRQVRRAANTWAATYGRVSFTRAKKGAEQALLQIDHPDASATEREGLRRALTQAGKTGNVDRVRLAQLARRVMDPHRSGIVRGPHGLLDTDACVRLILARIEGFTAVNTAPDDHYYAARRTYLVTTPTSGELRSPIEPSSRLADSLTLAPQTGFEAPDNNACVDLITLLGLIHLPRPRHRASSPSRDRNRRAGTTPRGTNP